MVTCSRASGPQKRRRCERECFLGEVEAGSREENASNQKLCFD
jgi:hypothetical protein